MSGFVVPPYPHDRLGKAKAAAEAVPGGLVDLSIGTPCDPPPSAVVGALATSGTERGYPASIGSPAFRAAAAAWLGRRFGVDVDAGRELAACVGAKEFVATTPQWLKLRSPERDTVLYPAVAYPTYEMGAILAGCRPVAVPVDPDWRIRLDAIDPADAGRALCLWVNTPGNPAGGLDDLDAAAAWGRAQGVLVLSDECYADFTWQGPPRTILGAGTSGVLAVHSLSKRSNLAGVRAGFYAGDRELVQYLSEVRKHAGFLVPGPVQAAAAVAYGDEEHVEEQRQRYHRRLVTLAAALDEVGLPTPMPGGGFYLWVPIPGGDDWRATQWFAEQAGILVAPGDLYGPAGGGFVRIALVAPDDRLQAAGERLVAGGRYTP